MWDNLKKKKFRQALTYVYRSNRRLEIFVMDELGVRLAEISGEDTLEETAFQLIDWAESANRLDELFQCFCRENPNHTVCSTFCNAEQPSHSATSRSDHSSAERTSNNPSQPYNSPENIMQKIREWPNIYKILIAIVFSGTLTAGLIKGFSISPDTGEIRILEDSSDSSELVNVDVIILDGNDSPIESVEVQILSKGAPETRRTDSSGFVQVAIPQRSDITFIFRKEGYETKRHQVNLKNDPNRTRTFYLEKNQ